MRLPTRVFLLMCDLWHYVCYFLCLCALSYRAPARTVPETSWTRTSMSPITSIELFLADVRAHAASQEGDALARRLSCWLAYYRTLQFVRERYGQTNSAYIEAITRYLHTRERLPTPTAEQARAEPEVLRHQLPDKY